MTVPMKDCGKHGHNKRRRVLRRACVCLLCFNFILLLTILLVWAILQPHKPRFILQDVTIYAFNTSIPNFLTSNFHITLYSRNPNDKIGIYYDRLDVYATYQNQQITLRTIIPPSYQGHKEVDVWSPSIYGTMVPIAPYNSMTLSQEQAGGTLNLVIKIDGRARWKVGTFISKRYHIYIKCPAFITVGGGGGGARSSDISTAGAVPTTVNGGDGGGSGVKIQMVQRCSVSV